MNLFSSQILQGMDQVMQLIEFNSSIELEYIQIAQCLERMRQRCCHLNHNLQGTREQLRQSESERLVLEIKLKHARNQVEVEMKKRHRAEAELEKQERKLQLIHDYLMTDAQMRTFGEDQRPIRGALDRQSVTRSTLIPGKRLSALEELCTSIISDISFDRSEDEPDLEVIKPVKVKVANEMLAVTLRSGAMANSLGPVPSMPPIPAVPRRRSQQSRCISTPSDLTTVWGSSQESDRRSSRAESDTLAGGSRTRSGSGCDPFSPSPTQRPPPLEEHHFTSKTTIGLESCAVCKSRLRFGKMALKCRSCQLLAHPECATRCPSACAPSARPRVGKGLLADFAPSTPPFVPPLVVQCVNQVERRGLCEAGLYRVPGAEHLVREWKHQLLCAQGEPPLLEAVVDTNVICGVLKDFLRNLKEPLVTFALHPAFLRAAEIPDESARRTALCHVVMKLPLANRHTLAFLMLHFHRVMQSPECQMDQHNLARVFGPTLVGHSVASPAPRIIMEETPRQCLVVAHLLALPPSFWNRFVGEEQENQISSVQLSNPLNKQDQVISLRSSSEVNSIQMSPGSGCLPNCIGSTHPPLNAPRVKKTSRFFPLPT